MKKELSPDKIQEIMAAAKRNDGSPTASTVKGLTAFFNAASPVLHNKTKSQKKVAEAAAAAKEDTWEKANKIHLEQIELSKLEAIRSKIVEESRKLEAERSVMVEKARGKEADERAKIQNLLSDAEAKVTEFQTKIVDLEETCRTNQIMIKNLEEQRAVLKKDIDSHTQCVSKGNSEAKHSILPTTKELKSICDKLPKGDDSYINIVKTIGSSLGLDRYMANQYLNQVLEETGSKPTKVKTGPMTLLADQISKIFNYFEGLLTSRQRFSTIEAELESTRANFEKQQAENIELKSQVTELTQQREDLKDKVTVFQEEVAVAKEEACQERCEKNYAIADAKDENAALKSQLKATEKEKAQLKKAAAPPPPSNPSLVERTGIIRKGPMKTQKSRRANEGSLGAAPSLVGRSRGAHGTTPMSRPDFDRPTPLTPMVGGKEKASTHANVKASKTANESKGKDPLVKAVRK